MNLANNLTQSILISKILQIKKPTFKRKTKRRISFIYLKKFAKLFIPTRILPMQLEAALHLLIMSLERQQYVFQKSHGKWIVKPKFNNVRRRRLNVNLLNYMDYMS